MRLPRGLRAWAAGPVGWRRLRTGGSSLARANSCSSGKTVWPTAPIPTITPTPPHPTSPCLPGCWAQSCAGAWQARPRCRSHWNPCLPAEVVEQVLAAESEYDHWSLFNRFIMAGQLLDAADAAGEPQRRVAARPVCAAVAPGLDPSGVCPCKLDLSGLAFGLGGRAHLSFAVSLAALLRRTLLSARSCRGTHPAPRRPRGHGLLLHLAAPQHHAPAGLVRHRPMRRGSPGAAAAGLAGRLAGACHVCTP